MRRKALSIVIFAAGVSAGVRGQEAAQLLSDARENLRAYAEDAKNRQAELSRKIQVLRFLGEAADSISAFSPGVSLDKARGKLAEARRIAETDPPLLDPVPATIAAVDELLHKSGAAPPDQIKARVFVAASRLEEHVVQQVNLLEGESGNLENLERGIHVVQSGLRAVVSNGLTTVIHVRRLAAK